MKHWITQKLIDRAGQRIVKEFALALSKNEFQYELKFIMMPCGNMLHRHVKPIVKVLDIPGYAQGPDYIIENSPTGSIAVIARLSMSDSVEEPNTSMVAFQIPRKARADFFEEQIIWLKSERIAGSL